MGNLPNLCLGVVYNALMCEDIPGILSFILEFPMSWKIGF